MNNESTRAPSKTLSCGDLGNRDCDFVAVGADNDEVKGRMLEHARSEHADRVRATGGIDVLEGRIDDELEGRPGTGTGTAAGDKTQGGEFLDDDVRTADREEWDRGGEGRNAMPGERVNLNPNDHTRRL